MKAYLGLFLTLFVFGCKGLTSTKNSATGGNIEDRVDTVVSYLKENYRKLQREWLLNEGSSASRIAARSAPQIHSSRVELASGLSKEAKDTLVAHAAKQVDNAVQNMEDGDEAKVQKEIFKLALKTVFLKSIIEQPRDGKFSFYPLYKAELDRGAANPLAKFASLIGDDAIGKMVESLSSEKPFSIDYKKEILTGLKTSLGVTKPNDIAIQGDSLLQLKFDVQLWLDSQFSGTSFNPEKCLEEASQPAAENFLVKFCNAYNTHSTAVPGKTLWATNMEPIDELKSIGEGLFTEEAGAEFNAAAFKRKLDTFKDAYVNENIAYLNYGIGTWLFPNSLKNIINDLKNKAKAVDGNKAKDFVKILDIFIRKMTRGHDEDPSEA